jgi:3-deoxy-manno-octulosonate cytidylyltransferase (CMP-KDO synthetase)
MKTIGVIPARYASSRFPGKPLADINGKPMIWWVYSRSINCARLSKVFVATDDKRISSVCAKLDIPFIMTGEHYTAANRIWEVSENIKADFYISINGDEPLIEPNFIEAAVLEKIPQNIEFGTNIITNTNDAVQVMDPSNIKVVFDNQMNALYMSRSPIPFPFKSVDFHYYKHIGILGYNKKMLDFYHISVPGKFESIEGIDTLRFIDYNKTLKFIYVPNCNSLSVDEPKDLEYVKQYLPPPPHIECKWIRIIFVLFTIIICPEKRFWK